MLEGRRVIKKTQNFAGVICKCSPVLLVAKAETFAKMPSLSVESWKPVMTRKAARRCEGSMRSKRSTAADRNWMTVQQDSIIAKNFVQESD